jgi:serine/threonine protein kinase
MRTVSTPADSSKAPADLQRCVDALARGECTEEEFLSLTLGSGSVDTTAWDVLAYIDQRYRRGKLAEGIFHSLKSRIGQQALQDRRLAQRELHDRREAVTIDLQRGASPPAKALQPVRPERPVAAAPERVAVPVGRLLRDRYVVLGLVGRGGTGDVFKAADGLGALHAESRGHVAIKVLRERSDRRPELMAKLQWEFECARRLSHPSVVKVYEFNRNESFAFYTMELLEGEHAGELLMREGRRPLRRAYAWGIIRAVGAALTHAHSRNVIHGDISPKNVMITRAGEVRVLDFGSSTLQPGSRSSPDIPLRVPVAATPAYASCELLDGRPPDARDDLYSLACLSYELLCGEHPFQGRRATEARDRGLEVRRPPNLSLSQWRALRQGLSFSREQRSISVRQWLRALGLEPDPDRLPALRAPAYVRARPLRIPGAVAATLGVAALTFVAAAWHGLHRPGGHDPLGSRTVPTALDASAESLDLRDSMPVVPVVPAVPAVPVVSALPADAAAPAAPRVAAIAAESAAASIPVRPQPITPPALRAAAPGKPRHPTEPHRVAASLPSPRPPAVPRPPPAIRFATNRFTVQSHDHFVELPVRRSGATADTAGFVWWTADASAKAGKDFVRQSPARYVFPKGRQVASVFVKLLTPAPRAGHSDFRVCLGKSRSPAALTDVTCSAIILPANSSGAT